MKKMNKKIIFTMSLLLLTILLSSCFKDNEYVKKIPANDIEQWKIIVENNDKMIEDDKMNKEKMMDKKTNSKWVYIDYSDSAILEAKWNIVLFFHADWCPTCIATEKDILKKWVPDNLTIIKTNFDKETVLKKKYWVLAQTTFVQVDNEWNMIKKWVWGRLDDIVEEVNK